jgi:hypothetical protein
MEYACGGLSCVRKRLLESLPSELPIPAAERLELFGIGAAGTAGGAAQRALQVLKLLICRPGWESGLGWCDARDGCAPTQAAAPDEGRTSAEQRQRVWNLGGRRSKVNIDACESALDGHGASLTLGCEGLGVKVSTVEDYAAWKWLTSRKDWINRIDIERVGAKIKKWTPNRDCRQKKFIPVKIR